MENELESTEKMQPELKSSVDKVIEALKSDPEYYRAWQANIAMAFVDEMQRAGLTEAVDTSRILINKMRKLDDKKQYPDDINLVHMVANTAADNFLKLLMP